MKFWDAFGKTGEERSFLLKLDLFLLVYIVLSYLIKTLDSTNLANAYVSGMQEDLDLYSNQYNLFTTFFSIGYFLGSVPFQILINRMRPSLVIPTIELVWSGVTMVTAACKTAEHIYGVRLVMGFLEAAIFPTFSHIVGSWYCPEELGKRYSLFYMAQPLANMFSGYIQAGLYTSMEGVGGLRGWRWLFIIDGVISVPIALYGYFALPDYPTACTARYLNQREIDIANLRMSRAGRKPPVKITIKSFFKGWGSWRPWIFVPLYNLDLLTFYFTYFNLWLEALGTYTTQQINLIPTGGYAVALVSGYVFGSLSDYFQTRWPFWAFIVLLKFIGSTILAVWNVGFHVKMFGFMIGYVGYAGFPLMLTWAAESFQDDAQSRGVMVGFGNTVNMVFSFWWGLVVWPAVEAPTYKVGYRLISPMCALELTFIGIFFFMLKRERRLRGMVLNEYGLVVETAELESRIEEGDAKSLESAAAEARELAEAKKGEFVTVMAEKV
ncbi:major facilitator superfamily domain-containing protein [Limtongia smithiae]|uniref:major facilitator superfamily domain-containing protein n=1 Tax=Limtongia smithiae TaxID=1125753 RepID=UPI0034CD0CB6